MKLYNYSESVSNRINKICKEYGIGDYTINMDGSIDVYNNVNLYKRVLYTIPLKFNRVLGSFDCSRNSLTSLRNGPIYVEGRFDCGNNNLISLKFAPDYVGDDFRCPSNKIKTLIGCTKTIVGNFYCQDNRLVDFNGFPEGYYNDCYFLRNPLFEILRSVNINNKCSFIHLINEYDAIRDGKIIIRDRLEAAYEGIGIEPPENITIQGYEII